MLYVMKKSKPYYEEPGLILFEVTVEGGLCDSGGNKLPYVPPGGLEGVENEGDL